MHISAAGYQRTGPDPRARPLSMSGGGFGASANLNSSLGGKPKSGTISMGTGNNDGNANSDNGWFMDPTPLDNAEFTVLKNAFAGQMPVGTLAASRYDVVIADYVDADRLKVDLQSAAPQAALLPILDKPSKAVEAEARQQYAFLIQPQAMTTYDALAEIDRLMESRSRRVDASK